MQLLRKIKNIGHCIESVIGQLIYGFPSKKLKIIGVTGTDGKTTVSSLIYHVLKTSGYKTSMVSSVYANIGGSIYETGLHTTTPGAINIQKYLNLAVKNKDEYFILETTAHGLDQNRVFGIDYWLGILTNISHEHIHSVDDYDYFLNLDNYLKIKSQLLLSSKISLINIDDSFYKKTNHILKIKNKTFYTYGFKNKADYNQNIRKIIKKDLAEFNNYNYLAGYAACKIIGLNDKQIVKALKSFQMPSGRLETIYNREFKVIIDFAHTINAIYQVLDYIKKRFFFNKKGKLIHVFGAAGLRDKTKRLKMGESSGRFSDLVILTEEDYRTEDPNKICNEIAKGLKNKGFGFVPDGNFKRGLNKKYTVIINRDEAIRKAVNIAGKDDVIVLTGKAHEKSLARGKIEYPWDEKEIVMEAIKSIKYKS